MYSLHNRLLNLSISIIVGFCAIASLNFANAQSQPSGTLKENEGQKNLTSINKETTVKKNTTHTVPETEKNTQQKKTNEKLTKSSKEKNEKSEEEKKQKIAEREKKQVQWIERTLEFGIQQERMEAIGAIQKIHNLEDRNRLCHKLRESLKDEIDTEIKTKIISVLGELNFKEALSEIVQSLDDENQDVKIAAVYAIKRIGDNSVVGKLSEELKKQDLKKQSNYSEALIHTLGEFKALELKDFAIEAIKKDTTEKNIRQNLIIFLGQIDAKDAKDFLLGIAKDDSEEITARAYAVNSLAKMKITDSASEIDAIIKEIDSYPFKKRQRYYKLYVYSIAALARMGYEKVFFRLENAARSNNEQVRLQAIKLLKEIKGKRTIDILQYRMKYDPSTKVQRAAKEALEELGISVEDRDSKAEDNPKNEKKSSNRLQNEKKEEHHSHEAEETKGDEE